MNHQVLNQTLKQLRLSGLQQTLAVRLQEAASSRLSHADFLELILADELAVRQQRVLTRLTKAADFRHLKTLEEFEFQKAPHVPAALIRSLADGGYLQRSEPVLFLGEAGTGNIVEAVRHSRQILSTIRELKEKTEEELWSVAREIESPLELVKETAKLGRLSVVNFAAGGIATPADAALMMQLGSDGVFVGSGIFKSEQPTLVAKAIVEATTHYNDAEIIAEVSTDLGKAMPGLEISDIPENEKLQTRGW